MNRRRPGLILVLLVAVAVGGCKWPYGAPDLLPSEPPPVDQAGRPMAAVPPAAGAEATKDFMLVVRLRMLTVQLPAGTVSRSEELWSYLNEEPLGARASTGLSLNGIRVGLGDAAAWPDVARLLRTLTGRELYRSLTLIRPGAPMSLILKPSQPAQTLFVFRPDRTLFGRDYPPGDNVLTLDVGVDFDRPASVRIAGTPLIRSSGRRQQYVQTDTGYTLNSEPDYFSVDGMSFQFTVAPGGFVLIGPGSDCSRASSPGNHFLVHQRKGADYESVLVISPEVFAAPTQTRP